MTNKPKNSKKLINIFAVIFAVLVVLIVFLAMWYWGDDYKDFDGFETEIEIPGLKDGANPQGITSYKTKIIDAETGEYSKNRNQNYYFISAYFSDGRPSRIYVTGDRTGYLGYVTMKLPLEKDEEESDYYRGHAGGIATNGYTVWVSSEHTVYCAMTEYGSNYTNMADEVIRKALINGEITFSDKFSPNCEASFLYYYDSDPDSTSLSNDRLYVGEFYRPGNYETDELHHIKTPSGNINHAVAVEYTPYEGNTQNRLGLNVMSSTQSNSDGNQITLKNTAPTISAIYSIPDEVQGFAVVPFNATYKDKDGTTSDVTHKTLILSQSYGLKNSVISAYDFTGDESDYRYRGNGVKSKNTSFTVEKEQEIYYDDVLTVNNQKHKISAPLYVVDSSHLMEKYSIPSMSEGLCVVNTSRDAKVCVLFESGAKKYRAFVRQSIKMVYSFLPPVPQLPANED